MNTLTKPIKATPAPTKRIRPVTVTIDGDLAGSIREGARQLGFHADTWARMCMKTGDLMTSTSAEAKEYRLAMALHELHASGRRFVEVVASAARPKADIALHNHAEGPSFISLAGKLEKRRDAEQ